MTLASPIRFSDKPVYLMASFDGVLKTDAGAETQRDDDSLRVELSKLLERAFGTPFTLFDGQTGNVLWTAADQPAWNWGLRSELCREVARRGQPEFLDDEDPFLVLALPLAMMDDRSCVAVATFVSREVGSREDLSRSAKLLGVPAGEAVAWASRQTPYSADTLSRLARLVLDRSNFVRRIKELEAETASLSAHVSGTYEEISLLHRLTRNLTISGSEEQLGRMCLEWLQEVVPASALAIQLTPLAGQDASLDHQTRTQSVLLTRGDCPIDDRQFTILAEHLRPAEANHAVVANRPITGREDWPQEQIRQVILVPLAEGEHLFGYLAALNHTEDGEFGTVEASLLDSVATILGIHGGNIELYRQQSELMAGIIRALTSAIDAKDPYTCGHSDRVARIAVRLAGELGCDGKELHTIYLSGLLHDIGKIGIEDSVLRKPDRLTEKEYEHIKQHVEIGHKILSDLGKLEDVMPVILHHHESWDGEGYPHQLRREKIPLLARIVAVADSFDAMSSDRPYRKGMPDEKIDVVFRGGAGRQWDARVVEAFFRARDDIHKIARTRPETIEQHPVGVGG